MGCSPGIGESGLSGLPGTLLSVTGGTIVMAGRTLRAPFGILNIIGLLRMDMLRMHSQPACPFCQGRPEKCQGLPGN